MVEDQRRVDADVVQVRNYLRMPGCSQETDTHEVVHRCEHGCAQSVPIAIRQPVSDAGVMVRKAEPERKYEYIQDARKQKLEYWCEVSYVA
jgi:hypothetical protein